MHYQIYGIGNGYRLRKWTRRHEFKSWKKLIAFHIALGKGMNPIILPIAKKKDNLGSLALVWQSVYEKENS